jgi:DNA (cytosine-5)-methyltransferase 1
LTRTIKSCLEPIVDEKYYYTEKSKIYPHLVGEVTDRDAVYQWRRKYVRKNKSGVCPTLTANMGSGGHNVPIISDYKGIRKLSPKECLRFQGFPESFKFADKQADVHSYKQAGNSVVIPVIEKIAYQIKKSIDLNY